MASQAEQNPILSKLAKHEGWSSYEASTLYQYEGFWYPHMFIDRVLKAQELESSELGQISPNDVILCSSPKSGTAWLKALAFSIVTRMDPGQAHNPSIMTSFPHDLIPFLEVNKPRDPRVPLLSTHMPYSALPNSVLPDSDFGCKIVYICRNPKAVFISLWHFFKNFPNNKEHLPLEKAFNLFCQGISPSGPYWDHVLGYWRASLEHPERVLFLKYEDMMEDMGPHVKRLAEFMGCPFSEEEDGQGVPARIVEMCSFGSMSRYAVNQADKHRSGKDKAEPVKISHSIFFRKGKVDDWKNYLTDQMAAKLDEISVEKFGMVGLTL